MGVYWGGPAWAHPRDTSGLRAEVWAPLWGSRNLGEVISHPKQGETLLGMSPEAPWGAKEVPKDHLRDDLGRSRWVSRSNAGLCCSPTAATPPPGHQSRQSRIWDLTGGRSWGRGGRSPRPGSQRGQTEGFKLFLPGLR